MGAFGEGGGGVLGAVPGSDDAGAGFEAGGEVDGHVLQDWQVGVFVEDLHGAFEGFG